jgi:hypothetical protein
MMVDAQHNDSFFRNNSMNCQAPKKRSRLGKFLRSLMFSIRDFFERTDASGTKSTALQPLLIGNAILSAAIGVALKAGAATWLLAVMALLLFACVVTFIGAYIFFMIRNPDALRSERFSLNKMAMERGLIGDDLTGLREAPSREALLIGGDYANDEGHTE